MSEFSAIYNNQSVKVPYDSLVKNVEESTPGVKFVRMGDSATSAKFRDQQGEFDYDLGSLMKESGYQDIKYNVDAKAIRALPNYIDNHDAGVAYNLERIKEDSLKRQYITNQEREGGLGYTDAIQDGGDWFGVKDGRYYSLNNKAGLDIVDTMAQLAAHAGSTVGTILGAAAAGVGATATGGAALATTGALGAAGAVAGEALQRGADKLIGNQAAKYNEQLTGGQEIKAGAEEALGGALGGAGGQLVGAGLGKLGIAASKGLAGATTGETQKYWQGVAAKKEANYLIQQLPTGSGLASISAEEAQVKDMLKTGASKGKVDSNLVADAKNDLGYKISDANQELLAPGSTKQIVNGANEAEEAMWQRSLRQDYLKKQQQSQQEMIQKAQKEAEKKGISQAIIPELQGQMEQKSLTAYSKNTKPVLEILNKDGTKEAHIEAQQKLTDQFYNSIGKKVEINYDEMTGIPKGVDETSLANYKGNMVEQLFKDSNDYAMSLRKNVDLGYWPKNSDPSKLKGTTQGQLTNLLGQTSSSEVKESINNLISAVGDHSQKNWQLTKQAFDDFYGKVFNKFDSYSQSDISIMNDAEKSVMNFEKYFSTNGKAAQEFINAKQRLSGLRAMNKYGSFSSDEMPFLSRLHDLELMSADRLGLTPKTTEIARISHANDILNGKIDSPYRKLLPQEIRDSHDSYYFLTNVMNGQGKASASSASEKSVGVGKQLLAGGATFMMTGSPTAALLAAKGGGELLEKSNISANAQTAIKTAASVSSYIAQKAAPSIAAKKTAFGSEEAIMGTKKEVRSYKNEEIKVPESLQAGQKVVSATDIINGKRYAEENYTQKIFKKNEKEKAARGER